MVFDVQSRFFSGNAEFKIVEEDGSVKLLLTTSYHNKQFVLEPICEAQPSRVIWKSPTREILTWQRLQQTWKTLILQLNGEMEQKRTGGLRLQISKITGEVISSVSIGFPSSTTWLDARLMMADGLRPFLSRSRLAFISPQGEYLTRSDDTRSIADVLGQVTSDLNTPGEKRARCG